MNDFESTSCPLCGVDRADGFCEAPDRFFPQSGALYKIQRCRQCSMVYLNPRPAEKDSGRFYEHADYLPFASLAPNRSLTARLYGLLRRANLHWKRRVIANFLQSMTAQVEIGNWQFANCRLLDVGCGTGEFLAEMKAAGWQVEGVERDERAVTWARAHHQIPVTTGGVEHLAISTQPYDLITLWHVLEHIYDPGQALATIVRRLCDHGWLLVAVPNIAGVDARIYKSNWVALDAPRHVNHFSLETLTRLGSRYGLTMRWWRQLPLDAFFNALMSEKLAAHRTRGRWLRPSGFLWPLRLLRAFAVAFASCLGGSHTPFSYAAYGASLVCFFEKSRVTPSTRVSSR